MVKAVVFDCFGVLYGGSLFTLLAMCEPSKRQDLIDLNKQNDYGFLEFDEYTRRMADLLGKSNQEVGEIFAQKRVRNQPLFDLINDIRSPEVKVGLLTNAGKDMPLILFTPEELEGGVFDAVLVSSRHGITKPNPEIYTMMAEKLGLDPSDCLMVDDTFENCNGAEAAGMKALWFADNTTATAHIYEFLNPA